MAWTKQRFEYEMKKFDSLLRLRLSVLEPQFWIIERKAARESKCLAPPSDLQKQDTFIASRDGYIFVMKVHRLNLTQRVFSELRAYDMWQYKSAGYWADMLEAEEAGKEAALEHEKDNLMEAAHKEAYDVLQFKQGERVSGFHNKMVTL